MIHPPKPCSAAREYATVCLLATSPHPGGSTDTACDLLTQTLPSSLSTDVIRIRDHCVRPCVGCGYCTSHPDACPLDEDDVPQLFARLHHADALVLSSPVYFYGPPAHFKGFIDRAQRFWAAPPALPRRPAYALFCAARLHGERLFEANLLILRCFLNALNFDLQPPLLLRGVETPDDLTPDRRSQINTFGRTIAEQLSGNTTSAQHPPSADTP